MQDESLEKQKAVNHHDYGATVQCSNGHNLFIPYSCSPKYPNACDYCNQKRSGVILYKLFRKLAVLGYGEMTQDGFSNRSNSIALWTLGTDIDYLYEYDWIQEKNVDNLLDVIEPWQKFNTRMKVYSKRKGTFQWNPLFYVVESGSTGNKLHIHILIDGFVPHSFARKQWSEVTGIQNPNVNFTDNFQNIGYVAKYTTKGALTYRFLGKMYKAKIPEKNTSCIADHEETICGMKFDVISTSSFKPLDE